jgi:plasmid stabilization system protein ParE
MKVVLRQSALDDLDHIYDWISRDNPRGFSNGVATSRSHFLIGDRCTGAYGPTGPCRRHARLIEYPYIIGYMVEERAREIVVLAIMHGAQDRGP